MEPVLPLSNALARLWLPRLSLVGCVRGVMLLLLPDALHLLTGIEPRRWLNRMVDVSAVLPASWLPMCAAVGEDPCDDARLSRIESFLDPLWSAARPGLAFGAHRYRDWAQGLALRAATSRSGRSLRQGRDSRRITGFAPAQLRQRIATDEGFWAYRIWQ